MKLLLIDDHPLVLEGMATILQDQPDMEIIGQASSGEQALAIMQKNTPDIVVLDLRLRDESGMDILRRLRKPYPRCRFIFLTSFYEEAEVRQALNEKVDGYILKESLAEEIILGIRLVSKGRTYIDPVVMQNLMSDKQQVPLQQLTPREKEVLGALALGMSNRDIATYLYITEYTVKRHVSNILAKLNLPDRTQAALYAVKMGMVQGKKVK